MKNLFSAIITAVLLLSGSTVLAGPSHYLSGVEGIKAATLPPPGVYWRVYNVFYSADKMLDNNGHKVNADFKVNVYALVNRAIYSSNIEILGGNLIADICIPLISTDISMKNAGPASFSDNGFGLGDILVEPFLLAWHGPRYDAALGAGVYLPSGQFDYRQPASPGKGFWSFMFTAGGTVYLDAERTWSASILPRYEINTRQQDTNRTSGDSFHFEWGLGKTLFDYWDVGVAGYSHWQVANDSGPGATNDREEKHAIGPQVSFFYPKWGLGASLSHLREFRTRASSQGNLTSLMFMLQF